MIAKRHTLVNALRTASEQYHKDWQTCLKKGNDRLAAQFLRQTGEANSLADAIEQSDKIVVED